MELIFLLVLTGATTLLSFGTAAWIQPAGTRSISRAIRALLDWAGTFVLFLSANLALGVATILLIRGLTQRFVTLYSLENLVLPVLSGVQAFVFQAWWKRD